MNPAARALQEGGVTSVVGIAVAGLRQVVTAECPLAIAVLPPSLTTPELLVRGGLVGLR